MATNWFRVSLTTTIGVPINRDLNFAAFGISPALVTLIPNRTPRDPQPSFIVTENSLIRLKECPNIVVTEIGPYLPPSAFLPPTTEGEEMAAVGGNGDIYPVPHITKTNNTFDTPELRRAREARTIDDIARNIAKLRSRISGTTEATDMPEGDVWVNNSGGIEVDKKVVKQKRTPRSVLVESQEAIEKELRNHKYERLISERIAKVLTERNSGYVVELTNEVSRLRTRQAALINELVAKAVTFQFEKFLNENVDLLKRKLAKDKDKRRKTFAKVASIFNEETKKLEEWFDAYSNIFLTERLGGTVAANEMNKTLKELTEVTGLVEVKSFTLSNMGTVWKDEVQKKVKEHLDRIENADFVKKIEFVNNTLKVLVGPVVVKHDGNSYYLGDIDIQLKLSSTAADLARDSFILYNTVIGTRSENHTPHVKNYGKNICWGTAWESVASLFSGWNWTVLIGFLWKYVSSYNTASNYSKLEATSKIACEEAIKKGILIPVGCKFRL